METFPVVRITCAVTERFSMEVKTNKFFDNLEEQKKKDE